ncbi:hypothetical protein KEM56_005119 [Ascosphaera pollenicola]|nr:hypothetical protein KEM56_005119 [Ascosphaera pollenicola]
MAQSLASAHGHDGDTPVFSPGVFSQNGSALPSPVPLASRKRNMASAGLESSPISEADDGYMNGERKRQPVKRACNECRQQKLRCDVVQEPFSACSRCKRLKLQCKIEVNFKRVGKRSRNAEMEREIIDLRRQLAELKDMQRQRELLQQPLHNPSQQTVPVSAISRDLPPQHPSPNLPRHDGTSSAVKARLDQTYLNRPSDSDDAAVGLLGLRSGGSSNFARSPSLQAGYKRVGDIALSPDAADELFHNFFTSYHPFLPFLDPSKSPDEYYNDSPLLYWTIIAIGCRRSHTQATLLKDLKASLMQEVWSALADVPQSYHIVKALALLCTWPFPTSSTSTDPTVLLCGNMMHVAVQIGLHRPSHAQDFSKFKIEFREGELKDRVRTWAVCNIVAQRVYTGYGQPSTTLFDWTLSKKAAADPNYRLPREIQSRLDIELFCAKVSESLYGNRTDPVGLSDDAERYILIKVLSQYLEDLQKVVEEDHDPITSLYLHAATLHLRLSAFFDDPSTTDYQLGLASLYSAAVRLLEASLDAKATDPVTGEKVDYTTNYLYQMTLAAGFVLFKLWKSPFVAHIDKNSTQTLFNRTIWGLRNMSVMNNDLPQRMTEVLARMWKSGNASMKQASRSLSSADLNCEDKSVKSRDILR